MFNTLFPFATTVALFYTIDAVPLLQQPPEHIPFAIFPTRCNITQFIYFWKRNLHVSGGISTHHQENTHLYLQYLVHVKPLLLPAAIVDELELV